MSEGIKVQEQILNATQSLDLIYLEIKYKHLEYDIYAPVTVTVFM